MSWTYFDRLKTFCVSVLQVVVTKKHKSHETHHLITQFFLEYFLHMLTIGLKCHVHILLQRLEFAVLAKIRGFFTTISASYDFLHFIL